ncbi:MAG: hypothetical protein Q7S57_01935 [bacterium]|nr:hypothetical protein [bacterium]
MGLFDLIFGGNKGKGDDPEEEINRNKADGDLFVGRKENVGHDQESETSNPRAIKKAERLDTGLDEVARRTRDMRLDSEHMRKIDDKLRGTIESIRNAGSSNIEHQRGAKLRHQMRSSYSKIAKEQEDHIDKMQNNGASERQVKEARRKLENTRRGMSEMYRRAGGSGRLK